VFFYSVANERCKARSIPTMATEDFATRYRNLQVIRKIVSHGRFGMRALRFRSARLVIRRRLLLEEAAARDCTLEPTQIDREEQAGRFPKARALRPLPNVSRRLAQRARYTRGVESEKEHVRGPPSGAHAEARRGTRGPHRLVARPTLMSVSPGQFPQL
jgi:hypothetical protein